ncbi:LOW QUALITY PROTEIN: izumo sperm-egg fusion protein 1 [Dromiciops gliroides]|uniref:LOW QUALITY PROTEIN: izumo sperm-egg fusion protein 1 n=1 Tax=Dromiciops gliroides TaxID=33562 RepID=UPI001CC770F6|nr:LOW QUALITY PROTEIN: izumo sperm-egg fusion protein 1 [Dromiciops gliroides]
MLLWLAVLALALSPRGAWGCLLCDPAVVAGLRDLEQFYLPSHMDVPQVLQTFMNRLEETVRQFSELPFQENSYQGVIDEPTLSKASWAFLKELKRIKDSDLKDNFLLKELTWTLHMQKENFARLVREFYRESEEEPWRTCSPARTPSGSPAAFALPPQGALRPLRRAQGSSRVFAPAPSGSRLIREIPKHLPPSPRGAL